MMDQNLGLLVVLFGGLLAFTLQKIFENHDGGSSEANPDGTRGKSAGLRPQYAPVPVETRPYPRRRRS